MSHLNIAVILGSGRPARKGNQIARWVLEQAELREAHYDLIDLAEQGLPMFDEAFPPMYQQYEHDHTKRWSQLISQYDGYVIVTPEYNHSFPAIIKNALDYLFHEWKDKSVGFVGYGYGGVSRAVEQLRPVASALQLADVRATVDINLATTFGGPTFTPSEQNAAALTEVFDQVESWAHALRDVRTVSLAAA